MNWEALGAIGELIGAVAVLMTLIYLALQIRETNRATRVQMESVGGQWWSQHNREMIHDPEMIELIEAGLRDAKGLDDADRRRFTWWLAALFYFFQNQHTQYIEGTISIDSWQSSQKTIDGLIHNPNVQVWWDSGFFQANESFSQLVSELRSNAGTSWQWVDIARLYDDA